MACYLATHNLRRLSRFTNHRSQISTCLQLLCATDFSQTQRIQVHFLRLSRKWTAAAAAECREKGFDAAWAATRWICMRNTWAGWWQIKSGGRQAERDEGEGSRWRMWAARAQSLGKPEEARMCARYPEKPGGGGRQQDANTCMKNGTVSHFTSQIWQRLSVRVFERQWVNAVLLMRIWKSNHRLRLGKLWQCCFKWHTATAWNKSKQRMKKNKIKRLEDELQP